MHANGPRNDCRESVDVHWRWAGKLPELVRNEAEVRDAMGNDGCDAPNARIRQPSWDLSAA